MVFFSYRTKRDSPAGDQFWKFSRQCSIFGRIGDQWVAISSPGSATFSSSLFMPVDTWGLVEFDFNDCLLCSASSLVCSKIYLSTYLGQGNNKICLETKVCFLLINACSFFLSLLIREYCKTWYHLLVAKLLYCNPAIKSFDLQYHTQVNVHHNMISLKGLGHIVLVNSSIVHRINWTEKISQ